MISLFSPGLMYQKQLICVYNKAEMNTPYNVKLEHFEGPLDLLLYLVKKNEIDIQNIPVVTITNQYLEYMEMITSLNLDIAGDFILMAATLIHLKSKALLPDGGDEEGEEEQVSLNDLKRQLLEYQQYKEVAQKLKEQNILDKNVFKRSIVYETGADGTEDAEISGDVSLFDLLSALKKVLEKCTDAASVMQVSVGSISVKDMMSELLRKLEDAKQGMAFESLFEQMTTKGEIITMFLAMLELISMQAIKVFQNENFSTIYIYPVEET